MDPPSRRCDRRPDARVALESLILRCLQKDPNGRSQDVGGLAEALEPFASMRGRASVATISRITRPAGPQGELVGGAAPSPFGTTADVRTSSGVYSPAVPPAMPPTRSNPPLGGPMPGSVPPAPPYVPPPTHPTWQGPSNATRHDGHAPARSSSAVAALLGAVIGVVSIVLLGAGGYVLYTRARASEANAQAPASTAVAVAAPTSPSATFVVPAVTVAAAPTPVVSPAAAKKAEPRAAPSDAGAAPKDAGPAARPKDDEDLEAQKRIVQAQCSHMQSILRRNDAKNNEQAKQVKVMTCLRASSPKGATCERQNCRSACSMLQDRQCLFQLDNAERSFPARF